MNQGEGKTATRKKKNIGAAGISTTPTNHNHSKANLVYKTRQDHPTHCTINNTNLPFYMSP
jgi:hypothetical protein|tara:strand:+ start:549 stop:731 length:183 start_codon:yes stop_codon:yes gene_type:complete